MSRHIRLLPLDMMVSVPPVNDKAGIGARFWADGAGGKRTDRHPLA
jgi:hypothetical protein